MLSDVSTDYLSDFFIGDVVCVRDAQDVSVTSHLQSLYSFFILLLGSMSRKRTVRLI